MTSYCNTHCGESFYLLVSNIPATISPPHFHTQIIQTEFSQSFYPWTNDNFSNPKERPSVKNVTGHKKLIVGSLFFATSEADV